MNWHSSVAACDSLAPKNSSVSAVPRTDILCIIVPSVSQQAITPAPLLSMRSWNDARRQFGFPLGEWENPIDNDLGRKETPLSMKTDLEKYFDSNTKNLMHKWMHYFDIYDRHFSRFPGTDVHLLEIGVSQGGSLQMWKGYFGPRAVIYGADINPNCKALEE